GLHAAALVHLHARFLEAEALRIGFAAGGDQDHIRLDCLGIAALGRLEGDLRTLLRLGDIRHPGAEPEFDALLGEHALELFCNLAVHTAEDSVEIFHDRDLGAEARPDRAELKADDAAA